MKKIRILFGISILLGLNSCAQNLTCSDFKNGKFYIPIDSRTDIRDILIRKGNTQTEYTEGIAVVDSIYIKLEWIDECTYRAKYDSSKMELNEQQVFMNDKNGIVVKKENIKGNCMEYIATMTLPNGEEISRNGQICKE